MSAVIFFTVLDADIDAISMIVGQVSRRELGSYDEIAALVILRDCCRQTAASLFLGIERDCHAQMLETDWGSTSSVVKIAFLTQKRSTCYGVSFRSDVF